MDPNISSQSQKVLNLVGIRYVTLIHLCTSNKLKDKSLQIEKERGQFRMEPLPEFGTCTSKADFIPNFEGL